MVRMSKSRREVLEDSKKKAITAGVVTAGTVALAAASFPVLATVTAVPAVVFAWRWWKHRAENGIRF
jgi:ribonuclease PH